MKRYPDWPQRLNAYLTSVGTKQFRVASHDCCRFVNGAIKAMTGEDLMSDLKYSNWAEAKAILKEETSLYHALVRRLGKPVHAAKAQQGDIAYINSPDFDMPSLGIVLGRKTLVFGFGGYVQIRTVTISKAFRIPFED